MTKSVPNIVKGLGQVMVEHAKVVTDEGHFAKVQLGRHLWSATLRA
jgi:hypothetical protein